MITSDKRPQSTDEGSVSRCSEDPISPREARAPATSGAPSPLCILTARETLPRAVVIRRDQFEAVDLAERAILRARKEACDIRQASEVDALRLRELARQEGRLEGLQTLAAAELALRAEAVRLRAEAGDRLLLLAVRLAERVLGQELRTAPEAILALVRQALAQVAFCSRATLRLHPEDARILGAAYPALATMVQGGAELVLVEDPSLEHGACLVEADGGRVDGSVRVLLTSLEQALRSGAAPEAILGQTSKETTP